jgi:Big-like domain-containing protein
MRRLAVAVVTSVVVVAAATGFFVRSVQPAVAASVTSGYWLVATDGGIFSFGQASFHGSTGNIVLNQPIVGMAASRSGRGYWMVATDGGIFAFGDARFLGSMGAKRLNQPIVAMAATPSGNGYWLVASDGGIFAFGDAGFYGSMGAKPLNKPIVDIAATPTGKGYWMVGSDGGIFSFGDARFFGGTGDKNLNKRIQAIAPTPSGNGYWMVAGDGGLFAFGDARFFGSASGGNQDKRVLDIAPSASGAGYWLTNSAGDVLAYGDAKFYGEPSKINHRITGIIPLVGNELPVAMDDNLSLPEDSPQTVDVLANDRDPEGSPLTVTGVSNPGHGSAQVFGGRSITYSPAPDFNGPDAVTYTVSDDRGGTATARLNIGVSPVNDRPQPVDDSLTVDEDQPGAVSVLSNDTGLGDGVKDIVVTAPGNGDATLNRDLTITYKPKANRSGPDSFKYKVTDLDGDTAEASVQITVNPVDDPVEARADAVSTPAGKSVTIHVLNNDNPGDGDPRIEFVDDVGARFPNEIDTPGGHAKRQGDDVVYTPRRTAAPGSQDSFRYVVIDKDGDVSNVAPVTINLSNNRRPVADDMTMTADYNQPINGRVEASDPDGDNLTYALYGEAPSSCSSFEVKNDGSFTCQLLAGFHGSFSFQFVADDGYQNSIPAYMTVNEKAPAQQPAASPGLMGFAPAAALAPLARRRRRS